MPLSNDEIQDKLKQAVGLHRDGRIEKAKQLYRMILAHHPDHPDALHLLGVASHQTGDAEAAVLLIEKAVALDPRQPAFHNNLGNACKANRQLERAAACYREAVSLNPSFGEGWNNLGLALHGMGDLGGAVTAFREAIRLMPESPDGFVNLGATLYAQGHPVAAAAAYEKAVALAPEAIAGRLNLARLHLEQGRPDQALPHYRRAVEISPGNTDAHAGLGKTQLALDRPEAAIAVFATVLQQTPERADILNDMGTAYRDMAMEAEAFSCFQKALAIDDTLPEAHNNLGILMRGMGRTREALSHYRQAIRLKTGFSEAWFNLANVLVDDGRMEAAVSAYEKALEIQPGYVPAAHNLANLHMENGAVAEAIRCYEIVISSDPEFSAAYGPLCYLLMQAGDWEKLLRYGSRLDALNAAALANGEVAPEQPFLNIARHEDQALNLAVARSQRLAVNERTATEGHSIRRPSDGSADDRIRIGYISNNFRNHPTAHLMVDLFGLHDRRRFKIHVYSTGEDDGSRFRQKISKTCDVFRDIRGMPDDAAARLIHADDLHIYVDLMGQTTGSRMGIAAMRPAPVQVRYLGMAGTTGADYFDYIIADKIVVPPEAAPYYTERLVHLPHTYQINSRKIEDTHRQWHRRDAGLPDGAIVFCAFTSNYKIDADLFRTWMNILKRVPGSVIWLQGGIADLEQNYTKAAAQCGVASRRLVFGEKLTHEQHLGRLKLADLALDTRRVNGAATVSDALWAGVPVVTIRGRHFASRMGASILSAIGLSELITSDLKAYEEKVIELAENPEMLKGLRNQLALNRRTCPLFDTRMFTGHLETAYMKMWEIHQKGEQPRKIEVKP